MHIAHTPFPLHLKGYPTLSFSPRFVTSALVDAFLQKYFPEGNRSDGSVIFGYNVAQTMAGPIDVGLRIALFGDQPVHCSGAFGFLGVVNRPHLDSRLLLEIPEDGF
jgi:hypothetical protein